MEKTSSAFVAIVGKPNVGKSSLLNAFIGEKVAIVSDKPQTTRTKIMGVLTKDEMQLVFLDTPGLHRPRTKLSEYMVKQVEESVADVDVAVLVTDPLGEITNSELQLLDSFRKLHLPAILAMNKIDLLDKKDRMLEKIARFSEQFDFEAVIPISVLENDGLSILLEKIGEFAAEGPHFFPDDTLTDQPERVIAAEIIREKILKNLYDELPHGIAVGVEQLKEREGQQILDIQAVIYCEKESHKGMVIGKKGAMLKLIGTQAREEMERFFDEKINLQCWVKVKEDWRNKEGLLRSFGFQ